jgi:hypothetical protein
LETVKDRKQVGGLGVDVRIISKWLIKKYDWSDLFEDRSSGASYKNADNLII